jgi:hypothetical protein
MDHDARPSRRAARRIAAALGAAILIASGGAPAQAAESAGDAFDYNGDGFQDLYMVRKSDGHLLFSAGDGTASLPTPVSKGAGWGGTDIVMAGDLTEDGTPDLLAREAKTGNLYTHPGDGSGGFTARILVGGGWNAMVAFSSAADFDGDGHVDLYGIRKADGQLYFYPGKGDGAFGARTLVDVEDFGTGWNVFDSMTTIGGDSGPTLLLHSVTASYYLTLHSDGAGGFDPYPHYIDGSLNSSSDPTRFGQMTAAGDRNEDGYQDLVAIGRQSGQLLLLKGDAQGNHRAKTQLAAAGTAYRLPATTYDHTYDYDQNYTADLYTVRSATATDLTFYPGTGTGGFGTRSNTGHQIDGMTLVETAGDMNGDWVPDLLVRRDDGLLTVITGHVEYFIGRTIDIGYGWNAMNAILGGQDLNGDGKTDIIARDKTSGDLYFYPGDGTGELGARVKVGTGWNGMREIASVGDFDHDGHADLLAVRSSDNCLYLYGGTGKGTFKARVQVNCGWTGYESLAAIGDADRDGHADLLARRKSDGVLFLYKGNGRGGLSTRVTIGPGWNAMKFIA